MDYIDEMKSILWRLKRVDKTQGELAERAKVNAGTLNKIANETPLTTKIGTLTKIMTALRQMEKEAGIKESE